jgi:tRNA-modifying protein YgfZ
VVRQAAGVETLASGTAFVDRSWFRCVAVTGADARAWLNDLVSADVGDLGPGRARRSLLLSPTGHIRADVTVADVAGTLLLFQDPAQSPPVDALLARYVLSSDVRLEDRTPATALFAFPGRATAPDVEGTVSITPSVAGAGVDLVCASRDRDRVFASLSAAFTVADDAALDRWRIWNGIPRFGVDALDGDLPDEAGLGDTVATGKGCYLGQEAVAKMRNLGHPRRVLLHVASDAPLRAGDPVRAEDPPVGELTGATELGGRWRGLARVGWRDRGAPLRTGTGAPLTLVRATPAGEPPRP